MTYRTFVISMIAMVAIFLLGIFGIVHHSKYEVLEEKMVEVELVAIASKPKHFYVDIRDLSTGVVWKHEYVSKHYNDWKKLPTGKPFLATRVTRKFVNQDNRVEVDWQDLRTGLDWTIGK